MGLARDLDSKAPGEPMSLPKSISVFSIIFALLGGCTSSSSVAGSGVPCGKRTCSADDGDADEVSYSPDNGAGKADEAAISAQAVALTGDGALSADDVASLFEVAGDAINRSEMLAIRDAVLKPSSGYTVDAEAVSAAYQLAATSNLTGKEATTIRKGMSFAGTEVPAAVRELLGKARLNGAIAFDVNETNSDGEGVWTPYPATTAPTENMTFEYTMLTPQVLAADLADTDVEYNAIVGTETVTEGSETYEQVTYEKRKGGTGNVLAQYDEVYHPDIYARGTYGQKWANNFAILSDGTIHALPAARRSEAQDLILTNPHLSRGRHMLFNGHLDIQAGVVQSVEMSGRLSKRAAEGKAIFIDPIALLRAWGFEMSPNLQIIYGNGSAGEPTQDSDAGVIEKAGS